MKAEDISRELIDLNEGQIDGVGSNPRSGGYNELMKLRASLRELPELFDARGIIVYPLEGRYVAICGNMRLLASREDYEKVPCIVLSGNEDVETLRQMIIKDNGNWGHDDKSALLKGWTKDELEAMNMVFEEAKKRLTTRGPSPRSCKLTLKFSPEQFKFVLQTLNEAGDGNKEDGLLKLLSEL